MDIVSPPDAKDLLRKWESEHSPMQAIFTAPPLSGAIRGFLFLDSGVVSIRSNAVVRFTLSEVEKFEYFDLREWTEHPESLGPVPTSSLVCRFPSGTSIALHELASLTELGLTSTA
jgi:hypothetical protein